MAAFYLNGKQASQHEAETLENISFFLSALFPSCSVNTALSHMRTAHFKKTFYLHFFCSCWSSIFFVCVWKPFFGVDIQGIWVGLWVYYGTAATNVAAATANMAETDATRLVEPYIFDTVRCPSSLEMIIFSVIFKCRIWSTVDF